MEILAHAAVGRDLGADAEGACLEALFAVARRAEAALGDDARGQDRADARARAVTREAVWQIERLRIYLGAEGLAPVPGVERWRDEAWGRRADAE